METFNLDRLLSNKIDWKSDDSHLLLNPRFPLADYKKIEKLFKLFHDYPAHIWVTTSGTTKQSHDSLRFVGLSKTAFLSSASAVNEFLKSDPSDRWLCCLPEFHVGGLGITARAFLSGADVIFMNGWNPLEFAALAAKERCTLSSLVPAQVFDLVKDQIKAPQTLRAVLVGAGVLNKELQQKAIELGWRLIPSYGMTECASTVAVTHEGFSNGDLYLLDHIQAKINFEGFICLKSPSLFSIKAEVTENGVFLEDPKVDGWYQTGDRGQLSGRSLKLYGRGEDFIKIGGESVLFSRLEIYLEEVKANLLFEGDCALVIVPDERLGSVIHLAVAGVSDHTVKTLLEEFNAKVLPFEKIRNVHSLDFIPRSALRKILRAELSRKIKT